MTSFWVFVSLLVLVPIISIAIKLFRIQPDLSFTIKATLTRESILELKQLEQSGLISQQRAEEQKNKLSAKLVKELETPKATPEQNSHYRWIGIILFLGFSIVTIPLYLNVGTPAIFNQDANNTSSAEPLSIDESIERLVSRLETDPENVEGWMLLGQSYQSMGNYRASVGAYEKALKLIPDHPDILVELAEALMYASGQRSFVGRPLDLLKNANRRQPNHQKALWLLGMSAVTEAHFEQAIQYWESLISLMDPDSAAAKSVHEQLSFAKNQLSNENNHSINSEAPATSIQVSVSLEAQLIQKLTENSVVYVTAKALNGPKIPLAVKRFSPQDLPITVELSDQDAMSPSLTLSAFDAIEIAARISINGGAIRQAGDLSSISVTMNSKEPKVVGLRIDQVIK